MNSEIMIKKALTGIVYMQIIILHRRYAIKQNKSAGFVKSKTYAFILEFWNRIGFKKSQRKTKNADM